MLSSTLNFRIIYTFIGPVGYLFENGTAEGPLRALLDNKADISVWHFDSTIPYAGGPFIFLVPPGREFTAIEKITFPFSSLWILIASSLLVGFIVIFTIKRKALQVQNFVFGSAIRSPYLNLITGFIGGFQNTLPARKFSRFLLVIFLLYSLVIRSLYQGTFFVNMQSNEQQKQVQSVNEMISKNFIFYAPENFADLFRGIEIMKDRLDATCFKLFISELWCAGRREIFLSAEN